MEILGFEIKKKRTDLPTVKELGISGVVDAYSEQCNNQLRGITNDKAKEYNYSTIEYYIIQAVNAGISAGIEYEQQSQINSVISEDKS